MERKCACNAPDFGQFEEGKLSKVHDLPDRPQQSTDPRRKTRRAVLLAAIATLIALGAAALGMGLYVSHQCEGFQPETLAAFVINRAKTCLKHAERESRALRRHL